MFLCALFIKIVLKFCERHYYVLQKYIYCFVKAYFSYCETMHFIIESWAFCDVNSASLGRVLCDLCWSPYEVST